MQIAQHQHAAPLRNRNAHRQLPHAQRDRLIVVAYGILYTVKRSRALVIRRDDPVSRRQYDLVITKDRVFLEELSERLRARHTIQQP